MRGSAWRERRAILGVKGVSPVTILVQRKFFIDAADRAEFERQSREGLWPAFLEMGAPMLAFGSWSLGGGPDDGVVTNTAYEDFAHWEATRRGEGPGSLYSDPFIRPLIEQYLPVFANRGALVRTTESRVIDLNEEVSKTGAFFRRPGTEALPPPLTLGRGSILSQRTYQLHDRAEPEFLRLSRDYVWPWLESVGGRLVAYGQDPLRPANEVTTMFAFRSLQDWHRLSRPTIDLAPPPEVAQAWSLRANLIQTHTGRLLTIDTDFGTPV